jgi:hypothetical protein
MLALTTIGHRQQQELSGGHPFDAVDFFHINPFIP